MFVKLYYGQILAYDHPVTLDKVICFVVLFVESRHQQ